jgi:GDP-L-fucose synthase
MAKNIFITGGTGFIGRNLTEQLSGRYAVSSPAHEQLELLDDEAVFEFLKNNRFDVVIHAATWNATRNSKKDLSQVLAHNLRAFFNLTRCQSFFGKLLYFGSGAEYDQRFYRAKMHEDYWGMHIPVDDYGLSKYIMSAYAQRSSNIYNLRLFGVFGRYEDWQIRFISNACAKAVWDLPITIKKNAVFDYLYIDDLIKITEWFIENKPRYSCYNVSRGAGIELLEIANKVRSISGRQVELKIREPGLAKEYSSDNSRLIKEIGNYPFAKIDDSIKDLYGWYLKNKHLINKDLLLVDK